MLESSQNVWNKKKTFAFWKKLLMMHSERCNLHKYNVLNCLIHMKYSVSSSMFLHCRCNYPIFKGKVSQNSFRCKTCNQCFLFRTEKRSIIALIKAFFKNSFTLLNSFWFLNIVPVLLFWLNFKYFVTSSTQSFRNVWSYTPLLTRYCLFSNFGCLFFGFFLFLIKGTEIIN